MHTCMLVVSYETNNTYNDYEVLSLSPICMRNVVAESSQFNIVLYLQRFILHIGDKLSTS